MLSVLKRPHYDTFTFRLFYRLLQKVRFSFDGIYLWSSVLHHTYDNGRDISESGSLVSIDELHFRTKLYDSIKEDVIILGIKDHLSFEYFNPWKDSKPDLVEHLEEMFSFYKDKKFILLTSLENLNSYISRENVKIVPWGGDITNQQNQYISLDPVLDKNFNSKFNYISLNRNPRHHRLLLVSLLHDLGLQEYGLISYIFQKELGENLEVDWNFTEEQTVIKDKLVNGFKKFRHADLQIVDSVDIYEKNDNGNVDNFKNKLQHYYKETFVEIVTETSYVESAFLITEKFLNSVYGCNFPIILCSTGTVQFLKSIGFDMFDDIVDHSYDTISNPIDRLHCAIYNNKRLLSDNDYVKELWVQNKHRFEYNVNIAKSVMYDFFEQRAEKEFTRCLDEINLQE